MIHMDFVKMKTHRALVPDHIVVVAPAGALAFRHICLEEVELAVLGVPNVLLVRLKISLVNEGKCVSPILRIRLKTPEEPLRAAANVARTGRRRKREQEPEESADAVLHGQVCYCDRYSGESVQIDEPSLGPSIACIWL